ncbi:MAG: hypothetical protein D6798_03715 [Deltaproteobacteria bacterium]|nr:MAG: hypothetical protein D6798_03715 [Deltaproteobacteria bacterium]
MRAPFLATLLIGLSLVACRNDGGKVDDTGDGDGGGTDGGSLDGGAGDGGSLDGGAGDGGAGDGGSADGGAIDDCPTLSVSTTVLAFTVDSVAGTQTLPLSVTNDCTGAVDLELTAEITAGSEFSGGGALTLAPGDTGSIDVTFTPAALGDATGTLTLVSNDPDLPTVDVALTGRYHVDQDGDGYQDEAAGGDDCDDSDDSVHPADAEAERDLADDDCDGLVDEDFIGPGDLWVTEIMFDPAAVGDGYGEWFEVYNGSGGAVDLRGWSFRSDDGDTFAIDESVVIDGDDYLVLGVSDDPYLNGETPVHFVYDRMDFSLANDADSIFIYMGDTPIFDVSYTTDWPLSAGASLILDPFYEASSVADHWCSSTTPYGVGDLGSPGTRNDDCTTVDRDEDGYTEEEGDCDDLDASFNPGQLDTWDGLDNDCDGAVDRVTEDQATSRVLGGDGDYLGGEDGLSVGDLTGDGTPDVAVGGTYTSESGSSYYPGTVAVLDGSGFDGWDDAWSDIDIARVEGGNNYNRLHAMSPHLGDQDGDGIADLFVAGTDYYSSASYGYAPAAVLIFGGSDFGGTWSDSYDVWFEGLGDYYGYARAASDHDYDGDGVDDIVYASYYATSGREFYRGLVSVFSGDGLGSGDTYDLETDSDLYIWGDEGYQMLGHSIGGGDVDGDGYDDLFLGAPGYYYDDLTPGTVYMIDGGASTLGGTGNVGLVSTTRFTGTDVDDRLGYRAPVQVADFDGDDQPDIAIGAPGRGTVHVFFDAGGLSGEVEASSADAVLTGEGPAWFGASLATADFDSDGMDDLVVGAPDYSSYTYLYYYADDGGGVYLFSGADLAGDLGSDSASWAAEGSDPIGLGWNLTTADFDGDGSAELLTTGPGYDTDLGALYVFQP